MQEFASVLGNALTGLFALLGAFLAWRLRRKEDESQRLVSLARERRNELIDLYAQVFGSLEQAIKSASNLESFELTEERSLVNAKLKFLGSEEVNLAFDDVADKLTTWSHLHVAASPRRVQMGDQTVTLLQAPDPTEKYKVPAQEAEQVLHEAIGVLRHRMREHISDA